ncbi:hypothetical protein LJR009_001159 [Bosea sp. LjRoot9]|uniref:hypothetical protein n=1 Tax=Bosea sp. LjRoot9 TaxID=3342341 RepID=UPI003ECE2D20
MPFGIDTTMAAAPGAQRPVWLAWTMAFLVSALVLGGVLFGFVVALDPFGLRVQAGVPARPLMDLNQRYMYPQLVRSGAFDSGVFGTSTMRLLDPAILSRSIGGRFANLAMNAATPWEQVQMADLFARTVTAPKAVIWGLDLTWCESDATTPAKRLTPRPFPPWLYDGASWADAPRQLNLTTLEISARLLAHRLGYLPARIRGDGYEVFTPPEASYDLARARSHLYPDNHGFAPDLTPLSPPAAVSEAERLSWRFPALAWLDEALSSFPAGTSKLIVLPPTHIAAQPREGSVAAQRYNACKAALRGLAARQGATIVDYAHGSAVTEVDQNYWDPLHFRLPIARRVEADLAAVSHGQPLAPDGAARLVRPSR